MRVFAALPLPPALNAVICEAGELLKKHYRGIRPVGDTAMHITIYFFGEINREQVERLYRVMEDPSLKRARFAVAVGNLGQFPPRGRPRVLFYSLADGVEHITGLYTRFRALIGQNGWPQTPGERPFTPHLTIARNKTEYIAPDVAASVPIPGGSFGIDRLVLFQSILKRGGAEHVPLKTVEFV